MIKIPQYCFCNMAEKDASSWSRNSTSPSPQIQPLWSWCWVDLSGKLSFFPSPPFSKHPRWGCTPINEEMSLFIETDLSGSRKARKSMEIASFRGLILNWNLYWLLAYRLLWCSRNYPVRFHASPPPPPQKKRALVFPSLPLSQIGLLKFALYTSTHNNAGAGQGWSQLFSYCLSSWIFPSVSAFLFLLQILVGSLHVFGFWFLVFGFMVWLLVLSMFCPNSGSAVLLLGWATVILWIYYSTTAINTIQWI